MFCAQKKTITVRKANFADGAPVFDSPSSKEQKIRVMSSGP